MQQELIVIKLGTAVITGRDGNISKAVIRKVVEDIVSLKQKYKIILVSSGAVGSGKKFLQQYKGTLTQRKAAAAIGNPILIRMYQKYFEKHGIAVAQALCERQHFSQRAQFLQLKETFDTFSVNNILPVVNENDLVSNSEIKFSDNDELATLLAVAFNARYLLLATSSGGLLGENNEVIQQVNKIDNQVLSLVKPGKSSLGLGGMSSKIAFTKLATSLGISVIITGLAAKHPLQTALRGEAGTLFKPQVSTLKARQKWLASGCITLGRIYLDAGAARAVVQRKSLLSIGMQKIEGSFAAGEVVQLMGDDGNILGVARVKHSSEVLNAGLAQKNLVAAHADDIVLF